MRKMFLLLLISLMTTAQALAENQQTFLIDDFTPPIADRVLGKAPQPKVADTVFAGGGPVSYGTKCLYGRALSAEEEKRNQEFFAWYLSTSDRIIKTWESSHHRELGKPLACKTKFNDCGEIQSVTISSSSGLQKFDEEALAAIKADSPFSPIPSSTSDRSFIFEFRLFPYNLTIKKDAG